MSSACLREARLRRRLLQVLTDREKGRQLKEFSGGAAF